jgi:hypothetical protein
MLVGEIGIDRNLFLYDLQYWEITLIIHGYFRRYHPSWEQARLIAHQVHYAMGCPKGQSPKTATEWLPFRWDPKDDPLDDYDDEEVKRQREILQQYNREHANDSPANSNPTP